MSAIHEDFKREAPHRGPTDKNFGWVFTAAFLCFGLWPLHRGRPVRPIFLAIAVAFAVITLLRPKLLHPANLLWTRIGILLGKVMQPIVTGLLFYLVFTPVAVILRWMGKDLLSLSLDPQAQSYWIRREPSSDMSSMINQF